MDESWQNWCQKPKTVLSLQIDLSGYLTMILLRTWIWDGVNTILVLPERQSHTLTMAESWLITTVAWSSANISRSPSKVLTWMLTLSKWNALAILWKCLCSFCNLFCVALIETFSFDWDFIVQSLSWPALAEHSFNQMKSIPTPGNLAGMFELPYFQAIGFIKHCIILLKRAWILAAIWLIMSTHPNNRKGSCLLAKRRLLLSCFLQTWQLRPLSSLLAIQCPNKLSKLRQARCHGHLICTTVLSWNTWTV